MGCSIEKQLFLAFLMINDDFDQVKNSNISDMKDFFTCGSPNVFAEIESVIADLSTELQKSYLQLQRKFYDFKLDKTSNSSHKQMEIPLFISLHRREMRKDLFCLEKRFQF